jgi:hypothetical protein
VDAEFFANRGQEILHRIHTDLQRFGRVLVAPGMGDQFKRFQFPRGEFRQKFRTGCSRSRNTSAGTAGKEVLCRGREIHAVIGDDGERILQNRPGQWLDDVRSGWAPVATAGFSFFFMRVRSSSVSNHSERLIPCFAVRPIGSIL